MKSNASSCKILEGLQGVQLWVVLLNSYPPVHRLRNPPFEQINSKVVGIQDVVAGIGIVWLKYSNFRNYATPQFLP